jgi:hypothetical protein
MSIELNDNVKKGLLLLTLVAALIAVIAVLRFGRIVVAFDRPTAFATFTQEAQFSTQHPVHRCLMNERCVVYLYPTYRGVQALMFTEVGGDKDIHYAAPQGINQILAPAIVGSGLHLRPCGERVCVRTSEMSPASVALLSTMNLSGSVEIGSSINVYR